MTGAVEALQRLRNDPKASWELRNRTALWGPDFLMVDQDCTEMGTGGRRGQKRDGAGGGFAHPEGGDFMKSKSGG